MLATNELSQLSPLSPAAQLAVYFYTSYASDSTSSASDRIPIEKPIQSSKTKALKQKYYRTRCELRLWFRLLLLLKWSLGYVFAWKLPPDWNFPVWLPKTETGLRAVTQLPSSQKVYTFACHRCHLFSITNFFHRIRTDVTLQNPEKYVKSRHNRHIDTLSARPTERIFWPLRSNT